MSKLPASVAAAYDAFSNDACSYLLQVRAQILETADSDPRIGPLFETLKWGQPAYLPKKTKSGTTIRLDWKPKWPDRCALYVHCQTSLVPHWRDLYAPALTFEDNRAILLDLAKPLPGDPLHHCIAMALTYHLKS